MMSQSVDLDNPVAAGSALPKVPSLLTSARALVRFSIDTKNRPFFKNYLKTFIKIYGQL
jgi:hypothetical protein